VDQAGARQPSQGILVKSCIDQMLDVMIERRQAAVSEGLVGTPFSPRDDAAYLLATSL
jgi:hypothetical protein